MWTLFWDMHSGGSTKVEPYNKIYIEAPKNEAEIIFFNRFGRNPYRITCTCCGRDYEVDEYETLEKATEHFRKSKQKLTSVRKYCASVEVLVIRKEEIKKEEKIGTLPKEVWVWV